MGENETVVWLVSITSRHDVPVVPQASLVSVPFGVCLSEARAVALVKQLDELGRKDHGRLTIERVKVFA